MFKATPHGLGCALGLPYLLSYNQSVVPEVLDRVAMLLGAPTGAAAGEQSPAARAVLNLMADLGMPTDLKTYGIAEADLEDMAAKTIELFPRPANPRSMDLNDCQGYWRAMYDGRI